MKRKFVTFAIFLVLISAATLNASPCRMSCNELLEAACDDAIWGTCAFDWVMDEYMERCL